MKKQLIPIEIIKNKILIIRDQRVMLDSDLAQLYGVETFVLNQAVKRNKERFPEDFMFQLTDEEWKSLISQIVISKEDKGGRRFSPYVFTEQGVAMLSSILNSKQAIAVNVQIMRVFVTVLVILRRANKKQRINTKILFSPDVRIYINEPKAHSLNPKPERLPSRVKHGTGFLAMTARED